MKTALRVAVAVQVLLGLYWTLSVAMTAGQGGLEVLYRFVLVFALQLVCFLLGLVVYLKAPEQRAIARWLLGLPFLFLFLPGLLKALLGEHVTSGMLTLVLVALLMAAIVVSLVVPRRVAARLPAWLFTSRLFNSLILVLPLLGWLAFAAILLWVFSVEGEATLRQLRNGGTGYGSGVAILMVATYLFGLGTASLGAASWGLLGLRSGVQDACRKLNISQVLLSLPGLLAGALVGYFLATQGQMN